MKGTLPADQLREVIVKVDDSTNHEYGFSSGGAWTTMSPTSATKFITDISPDDSDDVWFRITLPSNSSSFGRFTTTIYLVAEQHA